MAATSSAKQMSEVKIIISVRVYLESNSANVTCSSIVVLRPAVAKYRFDLSLPITIYIHTTRLFSVRIRRNMRCMNAKVAIKVRSVGRILYFKSVVMFFKVCESPSTRNSVFLQTFTIDFYDSLLGTYIYIYIYT